MSEFKGKKYLFTMEHSGRVYYQNYKTPEFKDWPKLSVWIDKCKSQKIVNGTVFNSLTWGSGLKGR